MAELPKERSVKDYENLIAKLELWASSHRENGLPESADLLIEAMGAIEWLRDEVCNANEPCECGFRDVVCAECGEQR